MLCHTRFRSPQHIVTASRSAVSLTALLLLTAPTFAQAPAAPAPPPAAPALAAPAPTAPAPAPAPPGSYPIPEGTLVTVTLNQDLKSGSSKEGSPVAFVVSKDVIGAGGAVLIKAGSPAVGQVVQSKHAGLIGKPGKLGFTCDYAVLPDGTHVPLRSAQQAHYGRDNRAASVASAVVLTPLALLVPGKDTTVKQGKEFSLFVDQTTTVGGAPSAAPTPAPAPPAH